MEGYRRFQEELHSVCKECSEKIAITYYLSNGETEECSYRKMEERILALIEKYKQLGIQRGDRVAVLIPLCTNAYLDILALAYMGATSVVLDINLYENELHSIIEDADVTCIITSKSLFEEKLKKVSILVINELDDFTVLHDSEMRHASDPDFDAIAILYSSGTTSKAKGVVIGYEQEINAMDYLLKVVGTSDIRYLMLFPNSHISGFTDFLVLLMRGGALATMEEASATKLIQGFHDYKPNTFGMIPKVWETLKNKIEDGIRSKGQSKAKIIFGLIEFSGFIRKWTGINIGRKLFKSINNDVFGGNLQSVHSGGGRSNPNVMRFFWNLGYDCFDFYASTEANIPILVTDGKCFMDSVGSITANPNTQIRIFNPDANGIGEIQVKNNTMMRGYFRNSDLTKEAFADGFFKTGDYGKIVKGELYITGRIKESIHLKNGEKVSPEDIEGIYNNYIQDEIEYAVAGVPDGDEYEMVCVFIRGSIGQYDSVFKEINKKVSPNYQYKRIEYVAEIPKTSVGKVKRYSLKNITTNKNNSIQEINCEAQNNVNSINKDDQPLDVWLRNLIQSYCLDMEIKEDSNFVEDLCFDSLTMFEIIVAIQNKTGIDLSLMADETKTLKDIKNLLKISESKRDVYPKRKGVMTTFAFKVLLKILKKIYVIKVIGQENIPDNGAYIICSNHATNLDSLWILSSYPKNKLILNDIANLAAIHTMKKGISNWIFSALGGIPVDREGNTIPAFIDCSNWLRDGKQLILFPEGARSRDGTMLEFKEGAAELAIKNDCPILPVRIDGGFEIFPRTIKRPRLYDKDNKCKYTIEIKFGELLIADGLNAKDVINNLKKRIEEM